MIGIGGANAERIETARLILRPFAGKDLGALARINNDPQVMRYFPARYSPAQTAEFIDGWRKKQVQYGYAFSAVERKSDGGMIGMVGLSRLETGAPIAPCTEIGWRLTPSAWGKGYATEAASAWLAQGFGVFGLTEILRFAPKINLASQAVMRRIGMIRAAELDFTHPSMPADHRLQPMAVYRLDAAGYAALDTDRRA